MKIVVNEESIQKMLKYAFGYSLFLGIFLVFFPKMLFTLMGLEFPNYIELWQYIGLMFGFLGIGYFIASFEPTKYWQIILIGFLSNIAALIRSYFPKLTAIQVKDILIKSVWQPTDKNSSYVIPQREVAKKLDEIGKAGGIVNAANAIQLAKTIASSTPAKSNKKKRSTN